MRNHSVVYAISRARDKVLKIWRHKEFDAFMGRKSDNLFIIGKVYFRNPNVQVGKNVILYPGVMLFGTGRIIIGDNTFIGNNTVIYAEEGYDIIIGNNCMIAAQCYLVNTDHNMKTDELMIRQERTSENVIIEDNVWIAANVTVLKGSHIRSGCVIGAKALVKGDTVSNGIYVGTPARLVKERK